MKSKIVIFAKALVAAKRCNNVNVVLEDYDGNTDSFYIYKNDYELYKLILKEQENYLKGV